MPEHCIDEQILAITVLLGKVFLKILLIWSWLLQDCKKFCPVISRPADASWLPVRGPPANKSHRSASFGVTDNITKYRLLHMSTLFVN
jgi:hypothetical protein